MIARKESGIGSNTGKHLFVGGKRAFGNFKITAGQWHVLLSDRTNDENHRRFALVTARNIRYGAIDFRK
jgi:ABC-type phosphonate transport system ATPase subunit